MQKPETKNSGTSRREFLTRGAQWSALVAASQWLPMPALASPAGRGPQIAQTVVVDKGFASVRKIGNGLYATVSDTSKGLQTMCNGGFLVGKDASLLLEGFVSPAGAQFQYEALKGIFPGPVLGALDTHYHFDHALGNSFYGANGIALWAHANTAKRIATEYAPLQGIDKATFSARLEAKVKAAKTDVARAHAEQYATTMGLIQTLANANVLALPNKPLDPAKLPVKLDLGGLTALVETYPGHSGTDLVVRVPEQNVVYAGDLLFNNMYPVTFDTQASVSGWRATLKTFAGFGKNTIFVPGHGQVCGQEGVQLLADLFDDIAAQAEKLHKAGVPAADAADQYVVPEKFKSVAIFAWNLSIGPTIEKLYAEWGAK
ncbi:MAG TPA: MBL fold metallo-hydrolase [Dongiaceae bacterium]|nr:MBL fold metallo-hydrolase [Dongiaceae bacterium]